MNNVNPKERPIICSGPMVQAILAGCKTQTRRVIKNQSAGIRWGFAGWENGHGNPTPCPYGQPGERLWVKEAWRVGAWNEDEGQIAVDYKADNYIRREWLTVNDDGLFTRLWQQSTDDAIAAIGQRERYEWKPGTSPCRWRPSIFMPKWASRITLEITHVWVERVQDISTADCLKEGVPQTYGEARQLFGDHTLIGRKSHVWDNHTSIENFLWLWDSINAKHSHSWESNPWVWVVEFKVVMP